MGPWWIGLLVACSGDEDVLAELDGRWVGQVTVNGAVFGLDATFDYDEEAELLSGEIAVAELPEAHTYAVRRSSVLSDAITLECTDLLDAERGFQLTGELDAKFSGEATLAYPCPEGTCGFQGPFELTSAPLVGGGTGSPIATGDTGAPPPPPPPPPTGDTADTADTGTP